MENNEINTEVLNDLIEIHNDRVVGYEKAIKECKEGDEDLRSLFLKFIDESHKMKMNLATEVQVLGGEIAKGTTNSGKIYRVWMDVKAVFTGSNRKAILESCEFGEDAAQNAYKMAFETEGLSMNLRTLLSEQQLVLKSAHDQVKALRDAQV